MILPFYEGFISTKRRISEVRKNLTLAKNWIYSSFFLVFGDIYTYLLQGKRSDSAPCKQKRCPCCQSGHRASHCSYAPLIKCKITLKRNRIFLFWDYQRKVHRYLHKSLKFHCDQIRNKWENGSWRAQPSKHHFTLHYFEWNSDHIALFQGRIPAMPKIRADFFLAISKTGMRLLTSSFFKRLTILVPSWLRFE